MLAPVSNAYRALRRIWRRCDPWTIRAPDWAWEYEEIPYLDAQEKYFKMVWGGLPTGLQSIVQITSAYIFPYDHNLADQRGLAITNCEGVSKEALTNNLLRPRDHRAIYGAAFDLLSLLRNAAERAFTFGETFLEVSWEPVITHNGDLVLPRFGDLPTKPTRLRIDGRAVIRTFDLEAWSPEEGRHVERKALGEDDLLHFVWSYSPGTERAKSPLDSVVSEVMKIAAFNRRTTAYAYALSAPDDHRLFVERSRRIRFAAQQQELHQAETRIRAKLGVQADVPVSEYYGVFSYVKFLKKCNLARREFLDVFSRQVLHRTAHRNNWQAEPMLEYNGGISDTELDDLFGEYTSSAISERQFFDVIGRQTR